MGAGEGKAAEARRRACAASRALSLVAGFLASVRRRAVVVGLVVTGFDAVGDLRSCGGCLFELRGVFERLGEGVTGGVGFAEGVLSAGG